MQYFITYIETQSVSGKKAQLGTVNTRYKYCSCQHLQQDNKKMLLADDALATSSLRKKLKSEDFVEIF